MRFSTIIDFFFPPQCVHCGREGWWLCAEEWELLESEQVLIDPLSIPGVDRIVVRGSYDCPPLAQMVQKLKYHFWTGLTPALEEILRPVAESLPSAERAVIIPVPLHRRRLRERGFNQALLISKALSRVLDRPVQQLLYRNRYTTPQATLSAKERTTNIIGAFDRKNTARWPTSVILVDDVITTGSTIAECAAVLRQHGVQKITAVAIAKG